MVVGAARCVKPHRLDAQDKEVKAVFQQLFATQKMSCSHEGEVFPTNLQVRMQLVECSERSESVVGAVRVQ